MSGSAALSAAKRRRGGSEQQQSQSEPTTGSVDNNKPVNLSPLQILNQHHNKLDLLYKRQDHINKVLNISDDETTGTSIMDRLDNVERRVNLDTGKSINDSDGVGRHAGEYAEQINELKDIILNVQSHSIKVSIELATLKLKLLNPEEAVKEEAVEEEAVEEEAVKEEAVKEEAVEEEAVEEHPNDIDVIGGEEF